MTTLTRLIAEPQPSFFVGYIPWPHAVENRMAVEYRSDWKKRRDHMDAAACRDLPPGIVLAELQTGGCACHHPTLMGAFFELPGELLPFCVDSCHMSPVDAEVISGFSDALKPHGLRLGGTGYSFYEEGLLAGIDPESAWPMLATRRMWLADGTLAANPYTSAPHLHTTIESSAEVFAESDMEHLCGIYARGFTAAIVYENCD